MILFFCFGFFLGCGCTSASLLFIIRRAKMRIAMTEIQRDKAINAVIDMRIEAEMKAMREVSRRELVGLN